MTIKFLKDYAVGTPPEVFEAGQVVENRGDASEAHFVRRGVAAYVDGDGVLRDMDGAVVFERPPLSDEAGATAPATTARSRRARALAEPAAEPDPEPPLAPAPDVVLSGADVRAAEAADKP
jgi:hypothetical protein